MKGVFVFVFSRCLYLPTQRMQLKTELVGEAVACYVVVEILENRFFVCFFLLFFLYSRSLVGAYILYPYIEHTYEHIYAPYGVPQPGWFNAAIVCVAVRV